MVRNAFTLIELLIVVAVIAILSIVVLFVLNPAEISRQSRDTNRLSDVSTMTNALGLYNVQQGGLSSFSLGSSSVVYVSVPDPTATSSAGDQCQGLGLTTLSATSTYHCAASSTYKNTNGTGWLPINFGILSGGSPIAMLPLDPINTSSSKEYYSYITDGSAYEITSALESQKYSALNSQDGGRYSDLYEQGTSKTLAPIDFYSGLSYDLVIGGASTTVITSVNGASSSLTFSGSAGQQISLPFNELNGAGCIDGKIMNPNSTITLLNSSCVTNNAPNTLGPYTLPLTGTYTLILTPDSSHKLDQTVQLTLNGTILISNSLTIGGTSSTVITTANTVSTTLNFAATAGQQITILYNQNNGLGCVGAQIVNPDTTLTTENEGCATNNGPNTKGPYTLPLTGAYGLVITPASGALVNETAQLVLSGAVNVASTLTIGGPSSTLLTTVVNASGTRTFSGTASQSVTLIYTENNGVGCIAGKIVNPDTTVTLENEGCATNNGTSVRGPFTLPQTGAYTIEFTPPNGNTLNQTVTIN